MMMARLRERFEAVPAPVLARWTTGAVAVPVLAAAAWIVVVLAAQAVVPSLVDGRTMTLSEAAALGSNADIVRLLRAGADPNTPGRVRLGVLREVDQRMTPLEAGAAGLIGDRIRVMQLLVEGGAALDDRSYPVVWCLAVLRENRDTLSLLEEYRPGATAPDRARVRSSW